MTDVRVAVDAKAKLGEGPVWCPVAQVLYWVDSLEPSLMRFDPETRARRAWPMPDLIGSLALRACGGAVVALRRGFHAVDLDSGAVTPIVEPEAGNPENRMNDGKCDRRGRFWAGSLSMVGQPRQPTGSLYRLDPDLTCQRMEVGIRTSNGLGWSPDNRTMYYTDSRTHCIFAYDFDADAGAILNRRVFAEVPPTTGVPDGLTVDAEGFVWSAKWDGWRLVRYAPDGRIDRVVAMPVQRPTSCSFGGPDLSTLYVTSASSDLGADLLAMQPHAGALFAFEPGVRGLPEPRFEG